MCPCSMSSVQPTRSQRIDWMMESTLSFGDHNVWMATYPAIAGVTAAALSMVGMFPYLRDMRSGHTRPHRGTWAIWGVIGVVGTASHGAEGGRWSLLMIAVQTLTTLAVLALAVRRGVGSMTTPNVVMLGLAVLGVLGWIWSSDPVTATGCVILADAVGVAMMLPKTWTDPYSETLTMWWLATVSGLLGMVAVARFNIDLLLLPGYLFLANGLLAVCITGRRRRWGLDMGRDHNLTLKDRIQSMDSVL